MSSVLVPTFQKAFCGIIAPEQSQNPTPAGVVNETSATPAPAPWPADFSSLLTFFFSFSALRDWLKLFVIGGLIESARRFLFVGYNKAYNSFFITATFFEEDDSYGQSTIIYI